ncbi:MAG: hypothetical protein ABUS56_01525 [Acidobacteriota bacterium]
MGITPDSSFSFEVQRLVRVTGLIEQDATTTLVDYESEWASTPAGSAFGLATEGKETGRATFRKYDDGWRIERLAP